MNYLVFDIETKNTFDDVLSENPADLDLSVLSIYTNWDDQTQSFQEHELESAIPFFEKASVVVGYNSDHFDIPILDKYFNGKFNNQILKKVKSIDMLVDVKKSLGRRIKLDNITKTTLGISKSANGLDAVKWWNEGKIDEIIKYCEQDVKVTKEIFEFALENKKLSATDKLGNKIDFPIDTSNWKIEEPEIMPQSLF